MINLGDHTFSAYFLEARTSNRHIKTPSLQRFASWGKYTSQKFVIDSLDSLNDGNNADNYYNSVFVSEREWITGNRDIFIIEGQQRFTHWNLCEISFRNNIINRRLDEKYPDLKNIASQIYDNLTLLKSGNPILILKGNDHYIFKAIFNNDSDAIKTYIDNKECLAIEYKNVNQIISKVFIDFTKGRITLDQVMDYYYKCLLKAKVSVMKCQTEFEEYKMFERLNTKTVSPDDSDLVFSNLDQENTQS